MVGEEERLIVRVDRCLQLVLLVDEESDNMFKGQVEFLLGLRLLNLGNIFKVADHEIFHIESDPPHHIVGNCAK